MLNSKIRKQQICFAAVENKKSRLVTAPFLNFHSFDDAILALRFLQFFQEYH